MKILRYIGNDFGFSHRLRLTREYLKESNEASLKINQDIKHKTMKPNQIGLSECKEADDLDYALLDGLFRVVTPKQYARILRDLHHFYSSLLLSGFISQDPNHDAAYNDSTPEDLFFVKILADTFDEIDGHA